MPVTNQTVTFTPPAANLSITGPQGYSQQFTTNSQGQVNWIPPRYGKYTLTSCAATQTVWVTVKPMIFHWWDGTTTPTNATIVEQPGLTPNASWRSRGVQSVAYAEGTAGHPSYTTAAQWLNLWSYATPFDGLSIDETGEYGGASYPQYDAEVQAVSQMAQSQGPSYSLGLWIADIHPPPEFSASAAILTNIPAAYCMLESYWISYSTHQLAWSEVRWYPLNYKTIWAVSPFAYASAATRAPTNEVEVREEFREYRLIGPESPGVAMFNAYGHGLDAACDQAIEDYYLKPVVYLSVSNGTLVAWNIGNEDAQGFSVAFLNGLGATLQSVSLSNITPNMTQTLSIPGNAVSLLLTNPAGTVNLYSNTGGVLPIPGSTNPFATWQNYYFTPPELANPAFSGPNADPLGKGMSNTNQFMAGFNPTNAAAYLHIISIAATGNNTNIQVTYLGANGDSSYFGGPSTRTNVLEYAPGAAGSYSNNFLPTGQTNVLSGGTGLGVVTNMMDYGGATNTPSRYYRVRVLLP